MLPLEIIASFIDPKSREREMKLEIQDLQQSYLMLECLYRKLVNQEPSSKKKKDQQKEQEVLSLHPYLAKRDSQLKRLYAQRARAVINGSASQDQIKREIDSLKSEMQQYVDTRKLDLKV